MARPPGTVANPATASTYDFKAPLWRWQGKTSWFFITVPEPVSDEIRLVDAGPFRVGFGALKVEATIGGTTWQTSIFPSTRHRAYLLPVKAAVRRAEKLAAGRETRVRLRVRRAA